MPATNNQTIILQINLDAANSGKALLSRDTEGFTRIVELIKEGYEIDYIISDGFSSIAVSVIRESN